MEERGHPAPCISFIVAGTETTGTTLAATMWFLAGCERCMSRLTAEIRCAFQDESEINMAGVARLSYLSACLEEGLRLATPAPFSMARITPADMIIAGIEVPKGTSVGVPQFAAWHAERNFESNEIPSRKMAGPRKPIRSRREERFCTFRCGATQLHRKSVSCLVSVIAASPNGSLLPTVALLALLPSIICHDQRS